LLEGLEVLGTKTLKMALFHLFKCYIGKVWIISYQVDLSTVIQLSLKSLGSYGWMRSLNFQWLHSVVSELKMLFQNLEWNIPTKASIMSSWKLCRWFFFQIFFLSFLSFTHALHLSCIPAPFPSNLIHSHTPIIFYFFSLFKKSGGWGRRIQSARPPWAA
jgi:hypothetical protein